MKQRIYFAIETKVRELNARVFFAILASLNGFSVVLGSRARLIKYRKHMQTGTMMFNGVTLRLADNIKTFKSLGFFVGALDEEGMISFDDFEHHVYRYDFNLFNNIDFLLASGQREKDFIIKNNLKGNVKNKIIITGNTRFELVIKNHLSKLFDNDTKKIKKKYGDFILLTTKFPKTNYKQRNEIETYFEGQVASGYMRRSIDKYYAIESCNDEIFTTNETKKFIINFSQKYQKEKLIIKPHPSENVDTWKKFISEINKPNVILVEVNEYTTNAFIKACNFLIASNCTTLLEAFFFNKLGINFLPYNNKNVHYQLPQVVSHNKFSVEDLMTFLEKILNDKLEKTLQRKELSQTEKRILNYTIKNLENNDACNNILDFLKKNAPIYNNPDKAVSIFYKLGSSLKSFFKNLKQITFNYFFNKNNLIYEKNMREYLTQKNPGFEIDELNKIKDQFSNLLEINRENIKIKEIYRGLFEFTYEKF